MLKEMDPRFAYFTPERDAYYIRRAIEVAEAAKAAGNHPFGAVLVDAEGRIIDCMRRMDFGGSAERRMLPGMIYRNPPAQSKPLLFSCTAEERAEMIYKAEKTKPADKWLMDSFSGLSLRR